MRTLLILCLTFYFNYCCAAISESRQKQLDSIVTNMPREVVRDLDSAHLYMQIQATSDEERVFMFYGFFGIHFKYDDKRASENSDAKEYSPYYTCKKRSGVCRDFSVLFKELCHRSEIPCFIVAGRPKSGIKRSLRDFVFLRGRSPSHAWNAVKFNDSWHLMDPTWTFVISIDKYYEVDTNGRRKYVSKAKRPSRLYYDSDPEFFYRKRSALHPAFYLQDSIPTFESARKKGSKKEWYSRNYDFDSTLNSWVTNEFYLYSEAFAAEQSDYCEKYSASYYEWKLRLLFLSLKRTLKDEISISTCEKEIFELSKLYEFLQSQGNTHKALQVQSQILLVKERLIKEKVKAERLKSLK